MKKSMRTPSLPAGDEGQAGRRRFWDADTQCLWWLDLIVPSAIHRLHPASGAHRKWQFDEHVTAMAKRRDGTVIVTSHRGLNIFDPETGALSAWHDLDAETPGNRANDAACDAMGRFWVGTMMNNIGPNGEDVAITAPTGKLFRVDADGTAAVMETGSRVQRAVLVADGKTFYFSDSMAQVIFAYDYDVDDGRISNRRVLNDTKDYGYPMAPPSMRRAACGVPGGRLLCAAD